MKDMNAWNATLESVQTSNGTVVWAYRSVSTGKLLSGWHVTVAAAKAAAKEPK